MARHRTVAFAAGILACAWSFVLFTYRIPMVGFLADHHAMVASAKTVLQYFVAEGVALGIAFFMIGILRIDRRYTHALLVIFAISVLAYIALEARYEFLIEGDGRGG